MQERAENQRFTAIFPLTASIHSLSYMSLHSFDKYLWREYHIPSIVLSSESPKVNKQWSLLSRGIYNLQLLSKPLFENCCFQFIHSSVKTMYVMKIYNDSCTELHYEDIQIQVFVLVLKELVGGSDKINTIVIMVWEVAHWKSAQDLWQQMEEAPNLDQKRQSFLNSRGTGLSHERKQRFAR